MGAIVETVEFDKESEGYKIYAGSACITCHGEGLEGGAGAPSLMNTGLTADQIKDIAHNGSESGKMPAGLWTGSDEDLQKLAEFIESLKAE